MNKALSGAVHNLPETHCLSPNQYKALVSQCRSEGEEPRESLARPPPDRQQQVDPTEPSQDH